MKRDGNFADLALGVASDEKDVITLPQNQTPRPKKDSGEIQNYMRSARRFCSQNAGSVAWNLSFRLEVAKPPEGLWPGVLLFYDLGFNGSPNLPEPLLACQGRVCLASSGCQIPEGHVLGLAEGIIWRMRFWRVWHEKARGVPTFMMAGCRCRNAN